MVVAIVDDFAGVSSVQLSENARAEVEDINTIALQFIYQELERPFLVVDEMLQIFSVGNDRHDGNSSATRYLAGKIS